MGSYYNKTRGGLPVTLASGAPMTLPAKKWVTIPAHEENSSSIANAIRRGFLARSPLADEPEASVAEVKPTEKIEAPKAVVAETIPVVQNQTPKLESPAKPVKVSKDAPDSEKLVDEPKRKRE